MTALVYIKKKMVRVTMEFAYIIHNHGPTSFVVGEAEEVLSRFITF